MLDPVLAEGGRQGGARKTLMVKNAVSQSRQFFTPVGCGVRCGQKDAGALFRQRLFRHVKAERGVARPTRKAERVERAPFKPRLDSADEIIGRGGFRFEGARKKTLGQGALKTGAIGGNPRAASAELFGEIGRDDAVRRQGETNEPGGRLIAAPGYAGPITARRGLIAQFRQRPPPRLRPSAAALSRSS